MNEDDRQVQISFTRKELCDLDVALCLAEDAQAFQFPDTEKYGWMMPELVGGEWIKENKE